MPLDLDPLRRVHERHGHLAGDPVLVPVADVLRDESTRSTTRAPDGDVA